VLNVIEIGEGVELHRLATPLTLDACAEIGGESRRLTEVASDDFLIHGP